MCEGENTDLEENEGAERMEGVLKMVLWKKSMVEQGLGCKEEEIKMPSFMWRVEVIDLGKENRSKIQSSKGRSKVI